MQISKSLIAVCTLALSAAPVCTAAPDNEAQARAREALRKKLAELEGQPAAPVAPVTPVAPVAPTPPAAPATLPPDQQDKVREALRRKIQELNQQEAAGVAPVPVAPPVAPAAPVAPVPTAVAVDPSASKEEQLRQAVRQKIQELNQQGAVGTAQSPTAAPPGPTLPDSQIEQMRQRVREQIAAENAREATTQPAVTTPAAPETVPGESVAERRARQRAEAEEHRRLAAEERERKAAEAATAKTRAQEEKRAEAAARAEAEKQAATAKAKPRIETSEFAPMVPPPSTLSGTKESRLAELTRRYKADEITPEEYHKERARIIAEP